MLDVMKRLVQPLRERSVRVRTVGCGLVLAICLFGWAFRNPLFRGNFGVVDPGRVYRSAQPGPELPTTVGQYQFGSILNLRGGSLADLWYKNELETTRTRGVDFFDFPLDAKKRPTRNELLVLVDFLERCRYPLLIHCKSGADRTGLVSALYRLTVLGETPSESLKEFRYYYAHVPFFGPERLHEPFHEYEAWLAAHRLVHKPRRFREWAQNTYESPGDRSTAPPNLTPGPRWARSRDPQAREVDRVAVESLGEKVRDDAKESVITPR